jgi:hypothetical protein
LSPSFPPFGANHATNNNAGRLVSYVASGFHGKITIELRFLSSAAARIDS